MADDKPDERSGPEGPQRPKRAPPTIDLEATEISRPDDAAETSKESARADRVPEPDTADPEAAIGSDPAAAEPARPRGSRVALLIAALLAGAIAGGVVAGFAAQTGWLTPRPETPAVPLAERASVEALAARVRAVEEKQASPAPFDSALAGRVDALEQGMTDLRKELAGLRSQQTAAASAIADLKSAPAGAEGIASSSPDLTALGARIDQIEKATRALAAAAAAQPRPAPVDDKPLRRVIAATVLEQAVRHGEPYAAALSAAAPLAGNPSDLQPLQRFAATGLPDARALCAELLTVLPSPSPEPKLADNAGFVDRLKAGAERLVRIRRTSPQAGDSRDAVLSRIAAAAHRNDLAAAGREVRNLPATDRAALQPWLDKVAARDAALAAAHRLVTDASAALGKPAP